MEVIKNIHNRRSIRSFKKDEISKEDIQTILEAGMTTPSAKNKQPWQFIIIDDDNIKQEIKKISQYAQMIDQSPISILVCGDTDVSYLDYWVIDCSASVQNILLTATALNIGNLWTGVYPNRSEDFSKLFNLPSNIVPHSLVILGYSDTEFEERNYFDKTKVHYNKFN